MGLLTDGTGIGGRCRRVIGSLALALVVLLMASAAPAAAADLVVDSSVGDPVGVAVDGSDDVFIADYSAVEEDPTFYYGAVWEDVPIGSGKFASAGTVYFNYDYPAAVAVDGSGDLFITDTSLGPLVEQGPDGTDTVIDTNLDAPLGVAVDGSGDVFVADTDNNRVVKDTPNASGGYTQSVVDGKLSRPVAVAVGRSGAVFIAEPGNNRVVKDSPNRSGGFTRSVVDSNLSSPGGVAVDGSGDVFIADSANDRVVEDTPNGSGGFAQSVVDSGLHQPTAVAVDGFGDLVIADSAWFDPQVLLHPAAPHAVRRASLSGTPTYQQTLHVNSEFSSLFAPLAYVYQWERCSDQAMTQDCVNVGHNSRFYKLTSANVGRYVTGTVTATGTDGRSTSSTTAADGPIAPGAPALVNAAKITGPSQDGQYVRVGFKFSSPVRLTYSYQWQRCSDFGMTQNCVNVGGDHPYYRLTSADVRRYITVTVTANNAQGQSTSSVSQAVGPIAPPDPPTVFTPPTITGTQQAGHSLAASGYKFSSQDALSYTYQWQRCSDLAMTQSCVTVGANSHAYSLAKSDVGDYITVTVTATDQESQSTPSTSEAVGPIS